MYSLQFLILFNYTHPCSFLSIEPKLFRSMNQIRNPIFPHSQNIPQVLETSLPKFHRKSTTKSCHTLVPLANFFSTNFEKTPEISIYIQYQKVNFSYFFCFFYIYGTFPYDSPIVSIAYCRLQFTYL